jgi:hypothetical protein
VLVYGFAKNERDNIGHRELEDMRISIVKEKGLEAIA